MLSSCRFICEKPIDCSESKISFIFLFFIVVKSIATVMKYEKFNK